MKPLWNIRLSALSKKKKKKKILSQHKIKIKWWDTKLYDMHNDDVFEFWLNKPTVLIRQPAPIIFPWTCRLTSTKYQHTVLIRHLSFVTSNSANAYFKQPKSSHWLGIWISVYVLIEKLCFWFSYPSHLFLSNWWFFFSISYDKTKCQTKVIDLFRIILRFFFKWGKSNEMQRKIGKRFSMIYDFIVEEILELSNFIFGGIWET